MKSKIYIAALATLIIALTLAGCAGPVVRHEIRDDRRDDRDDRQDYRRGY